MPFADLREVMYYSLTGDSFDGGRAAEIGLVNFAVPKIKLEEETLKLAAKLTGKDPLALKETKEVLLSDDCSDRH